MLSSFVLVMKEFVSLEVSWWCGWRLCFFPWCDVTSFNWFPTIQRSIMPFLLLGPVNPWRWRHCGPSKCGEMITHWCSSVISQTNEILNESIYFYVCIYPRSEKIIAIEKYRASWYLLPFWETEHVNHKTIIVFYGLYYYLINWRDFPRVTASKMW